MFIIPFFFYLYVFAPGSYAQDCVWNKDTEWPTAYPPLLINQETWKAYLPIMEDGERVTRITEGTTVVVACPGNSLAIGGEVAEGVCAGSDLIIDSSAYSISDLACGSRVDDNAIYYSDGSTCGENNAYRLISIGFDVTGYQFYEVVQVCFDDEEKESLYAKHFIYGESVAASDGNPDRPSFQMGNGFYDFDPNECYLTANQDEYFTEITGDPDFIDLNSNTYFSRGHLAANADFFTEMEADATFYYMNAIPQWQEFNGANWAYFELAVRNLADAHQSDLEIWTGPTQDFTLDVDGTETKIYHCGSQDSDTVPIPGSVWKVIYEASSDSGLAVVISNTPYQDSEPIPICSNIGCDTVSWITDNVFYPEDIENGFMYCCSVQDFRDAEPNAPDLPTAGLLLN